MANGSGLSMSTERKACTVLVTGVGAVIGQGIVKSLRLADADVRIVGLDRSAEAVGRHACDAFQVKPPLDERDPAYLAFLLGLVEELGIDLILPGIEQDVFFFDAQRDAFAASRARVVLNDPALIELGRDKWRLHQALLRAGLPAIPTCLANTWAECLATLGEPPFWAKPRQGSGGQGQGRVEDEEDFAYLRRKQGEGLMIQRLTGSADEEYTVGIFGFGDGRATRPAIFRRRLGPGGATWRAESVAHDPAIERFATALVQAFAPLGPTNFQFRKSDGEAWLLEINPRFSASTSLRAALGFNEAAMCLDFFLHGREPAFERLRPARCFRYIEDHIEFL